MSISGIILVNNNDIHHHIIIVTLSLASYAFALRSSWGLGLAAVSVDFLPMILERELSRLHLINLLLQ